MSIAEFLVNPERMRPLYAEIPDVRGVRLRSVNLNWRGPEVALRGDLPRFPDPAPPEWIDAGLNTVQCQLRFLAARNISLTRWDPPTTADIEVTRTDDRHSVHVRAHGDGVELGFDCSDSVLIGHLSAFRIGPDGSDAGRHAFVSKVDARRHASLPETCDKTFYERF